MSREDVHPIQGHQLLHTTSYLELDQGKCILTSFVVVTVLYAAVFTGHATPSLSFSLFFFWSKEIHVFGRHAYSLLFNCT